MSINSDLNYIKLLVKNLDSECKKLDSEYFLNSGGCCYTAWVIGGLLKRAKIEHELIIVGCSGITEISQLKYSCRHYYINIKGLFINRDTFKDSGVSIKNKHNSDILKHYKHCSWNKLYDKSLNNVVKRRLTKVYEESRNSFLS